MDGVKNWVEVVQMSLVADQNLVVHEMADRVAIPDFVGAYQVVDHLPLVKVNVAMDAAIGIVVVVMKVVSYYYCPDYLVQVSNEMTHQLGSPVADISFRQVLVSHMASL